MAVELSFRAMGTDVHIVLVGASAKAAHRARAGIERFERLWSRFLPDSEISALNRSDGAPVRVSRETFDLVRLAVEGWCATASLFDPTVLRTLEAAGYDRTFESIPVDGPVRAPAPSPGCEGIVLNSATTEVALPPGTGFDPGGIGKGYAADLVLDRLIEDGDARGACVNLGGDMRVTGDGPQDVPWTVAVEDPLAGTERAKIVLEEGAIATSSRARRRWRRGGNELHHIIDPRTGAPARTDVVSATVVTGDGWWAEVLAKAVFLAGIDEGARILKELDTPGLLIDEAGGAHAIAGMEVWLS